MTIPVLTPITARVTLPAEHGLREAWEALQRAERLERLFHTRTYEKAADRAYGDMVQAAAKVNTDVLRGPSVRQWAEDFYRRTTLPNNQEMGT